MEDDTPEMMLRVDDDTMPLVTRLHSRRSVVATVSLAELDRITSAGVVVDRTFGTELELGEIETVVSHPQANAQCARFIRARLPNARVLPGSSTADSVRMRAMSRSCRSSSAGSSP